MKYLVTGGAGFIGSHLVDRLLVEDHDVCVIDDLSSGHIANLEQATQKGVRFFQTSINDDLNDFFAQENFDAVIHLAACPKPQFSIEHPGLTHQINVEGTINVLECARKFNVGRFVLASSAAIYGSSSALPLFEDTPAEPLSPYALHKLVGEEYLAAYHRIYAMKTVALRFFNVFGPRQDPAGEYAGAIPKFITAMIAGEGIVINGDGHQTRDFIYVGDVVDALVLAVSTDDVDCFGQVFNIGSNKAVSVNELIDIISSQLGADAASRVTYGPSVLEPKHSLANIDKGRNRLKWTPQIARDEGLRRTVEYFKTQLA